MTRPINIREPSPLKMQYIDMQTSYSQKLFFKHFINIFHCWTIILSPKWTFIVVLPQYTTNGTTKGEEAIADKSVKLPVEFPFHALAICAGCHGTTYAQRQCRTGHAPWSSHFPLLLWLSQSNTSAVCRSGKTAFSYLNLGHKAELPALQMPFSSGKLQIPISVL